MYGIIFLSVCLVREKKIIYKLIYRIQHFQFDLKNNKVYGSAFVLILIIFYSINDGHFAIQHK